MANRIREVGHLVGDAPMFILGQNVNVVSEIGMGGQP